MKPTLTISDLVNAFREHTTLKAVALLRDGFDKNITISAQVEDVAEARHSLPNTVKVSLITAEADGLKISAEFSTETDKDIEKRLLELERLDFIKVSGVVSSFAPNVLNLTGCTFEKIEDYKF